MVIRAFATAYAVPYQYRVTPPWCDSAESRHLSQSKLTDKNTACFSASGEYSDFVIIFIVQHFVETHSF